MATPEKIEFLTENLPDGEAARRFFGQLSEKHAREAKKLLKNEALLSDVLTLAAFSPLLATTVLQNPNYISWLERQRISAKVRGKDELLESLARFALTNTNVETNILLARFRRRELLRVYLQDIRGLATIGETTEEISNLADSILEYAARQARQTLDNRYGAPLETDEKQRVRPATFCVVALGKLGSKELNYASDIDLLFLYSGDGATGGGSEETVITNREYFAKLAAAVTKLVGAQAGEGAAYRVDLRLRPHGSVGAPAISLNEAINYYETAARAWERQVLIRSRACASDRKIFQDFFEAVKSTVFSIDETVENALENVRRSKEKINLEKNFDNGNFNVKLGRGGIREIEFIAQALQLAHAGKDEWLRAPHTLVSLARLADRKILSATDLTELVEAYGFLRALEHRLQMENGLQTHRVSEAADKRFLTARRMNFASVGDFDRTLEKHAANVNRIFERVFTRADGEKNAGEKTDAKDAPQISHTRAASNSGALPQSFSHIELLPDTSEKSGVNRTLESIFSSVEKDDDKTIDLSGKTLKIVERLAEVSPHFSETLAANPALIKNLPDIENVFGEKDYRKILLTAVESATNFKDELCVLRKRWTRALFEIVVFDVFERIERGEAKRAQTKLAEASVEAALLITKRELARRLKTEIENFPLAVLGLGKLGGGGMDYNSDLDLVLIYERNKDEGGRMKAEENAALNSSFRLPPSSLAFARAVEIFVTVLSSLTRDGYLYRVDLRLRPDGKNGATSLSAPAFLNYLKERAAVWEWLAYVKLRGVGGNLQLAKATENEARKIIHQKARRADKAELKNETRRVRERLEQEKADAHKTNEIDIKFGAGGMLDVYFAMRFLQLRDDVPDDEKSRSTVFMLEKLRENDSLNREDFENFSNGYKFLSETDHNLRLVVGRSTRLPLANQNALQIIAQRMKLASVKDFLEQLTVHRLNVRAAFDRILSN